MSNSYLNLSKHAITVHDFSFQEKIAFGNHMHTFYSSTPSIFKHNNEYYLNLRMVNYFLCSYGSFKDTDKTITCNKLIKLTDKFQIDENFEYRIISEMNGFKHSGLEDIRIVRLNDNQIVFTCSSQVRETKNIKGDVSPMISCFIGNININKLQIDLEEIESPVFKLIEKNWVFLPSGQIIYDWFPLTICSKKENQLQVDKKLIMPGIFNLIKGSTNGVKFQDEILFICHITSNTSRENNDYFHLFVMLDVETFNVKRWSDVFKFENQKVEFCLGLLIEENKIFLTYSCWDRQSKLAIFEINDLFKSIKFFYP